MWVPPLPRPLDNSSHAETEQPIGPILSFLVLPDIRLPDGLVARLEPHSTTVLAKHRSGRPWVLGALGRSKSYLSVRRDLQVMLFSDSPVDPAVVEREVNRISRLTDLDALSSKLAGNFHIVASLNGDVRFQGSLSTSRHVFWSSICGMTVASDNQALLRKVAGARVDVTQLALRLTLREPIASVFNETIWEGIRSLGVGRYLSIDVNGNPSESVWWKPPIAMQTFQEVVAPLRSALSNSIEARIHGHEVVSSDLSGGLDSTSISYLVAPRTLSFHTVFFMPRDTTNSDIAWSRRAARKLKTFHIEAINDLPKIDLATPSVYSLVDIWPEGPGNTASLVQLVNLLTRTLAGTRSSLHLNGHGGDELFGPVGAMPWSYFRSQGLSGLAAIRSFQKVNKLNTIELYKMLAVSGSVSDDLKRLLTMTKTPRPFSMAEYPRWVPATPLPSYITKTTRERVNAYLETRIKDEPSPLGEDRTTHQIIEGVIYHGALIRRMNQVHIETAIPTFDGPLLDLAVVEAALSLRITDRFQPGTRLAKPMLAAAMENCMPRQFFERRDKGEYSAESYVSFRNQRDQLESVFSESVLADLGLIDIHELRNRVDDFSFDGSSMDRLMETGFAELWTRDAEQLEVV